MHSSPDDTFQEGTGRQGRGAGHPWAELPSCPSPKCSGLLVRAGETPLPFWTISQGTPGLSPPEVRKPKATPQRLGRGGCDRLHSVLCSLSEKLGRRCPGWMRGREGVRKGAEWLSLWTAPASSVSRQVWGAGQPISRYYFVS